MGTAEDQSTAPTLRSLQERLRGFASQRDWEQYHTPKNLVLALVGEVGELAEIFQWLTDEEAGGAMEDPRRAEQIRSELADVAIYLLRLADVLRVDLSESILTKVAENERRYPVEQVRGRAVKHTELRADE